MVDYDEVSLKTIRHALRWGIHGRFNHRVLAAYILGSRSRGDFRFGSDIDIGVVIPKIRGKTSLKVTDNYHAKYRSDAEKPTIRGIMVDFQFFYPGEIEYLINNEQYSVIEVF